MADEEMKYTVSEKSEEQAKDAGPRQVPVSFTGKRVPTSYANAFQTRVMDGMVCLSYGLSYGEPLTRGGETVQGLAVDMERRVVMTPDAAGRLLNALAGMLRPAGQTGGPAQSATEGEAETFGQK